MSSPKQKILFITPSKSISGAEKSLIDLLDIVSPVCDPVLALPEESELQQILKGKVEFCLIDFIRLNKKVGFFRICLAMIRIVQRAYLLSKYIKTNEIEVIYSNTNQAHIYSIILNLFVWKKTIWHVRDNLKCNIFTSIGSYFSNRIICISEHIYQQLPDKKKAEIIYNGIDTAIWKPDPNFFLKLKEELGLSNETILIAHVGQLIPWKRHDLFVDVAATLIGQSIANIHFVIIGDDLLDDFGKYKEKLISSINRNNLSGSISMIGYREDILECLNGIDILVHLADEEPFGRVVIEAMALEKPVVSRKVGGPAEIIVDETSGYLIANADVNLIAHKLDQLIGKPQLRNEFGSAGRRIVEEKFSIQNLKKVNAIILQMNEKHSN